MSLMVDITADQPPLPGRLVVQDLASEEVASLAEHQRLVNETLGEEDGVLIIDGSDFPKHGDHSVGVAPQWCGHTGKKDNCQAGVFLGYASRKGATLLDRRLYLPESWFDKDHKTRWQDCQVPNETPFQTKHELAAQLVEGIMASGRPAAWRLCP
jgi:SRSO17 transposase